MADVLLFERLVLSAKSMFLLLNPGSASSKIIIICLRRSHIDWLTIPKVTLLLRCWCHCELCLCQFGITISRRVAEFIFENRRPYRVYVIVLRIFIVFCLEVDFFGCSQLQRRLFLCCILCHAHLIDEMSFQLEDLFLCW